MYHDVAVRGEWESTGFPGPLAARYKLTPDQFEAQLEAIASVGIRPGIVEAGLGGPACALSFDDGGRSALYAADAMERHGWRGHFFITTGRLATPGFLSASAVTELAARGHAIGCHSHTHPTYMGALEPKAIVEEWRRSRDILGELLGEPPTTASVPGGYTAPRVVESARTAGLSLLFTSDPIASVKAAAGVEVRGRFAMTARLSPREVGQVAAGLGTVRSRLWLEWRAKALVKRLISPSGYERIRRLGI